jgi:hypothetical protein
MSLEAKLQQASVEYQKLQADLSKAVEARQRLDAQLSENELVKKVPLVRTDGENRSDTTFPRNLINLRKGMRYTSSLAQF